MKVVVVGGGIMGSGIAHVAAVARFDVAIVESEERFVAPARERVERYAERAREQSPDAPGPAPVSIVTDLAGAVAEADVVVEAVPEDLAVKRALFALVGPAAREGAVLASNTSGLPIEVLGAASGRPEQVVGTHFFNPVPLMKLVEVVRSPFTSEATMASALHFCRALGKETVEVRDLPGFVTTRLGTVLMCEAVRALEQGVASAADIDSAMRLGYNHPMGPLALADRVGLDTLLAILDDMREAYGEGFRAPPMLRQMVAAGRLGRKSGRGFYDYG